MQTHTRTSSICLFLSVLSCFTQSTIAASTAEWKSRSIYQIMIDRFALDNGSTTAPCNVTNYCGGTWKAAMNNLDYVQGMGFDAIYISPLSEQITEETTEGEAYHGYWVQDFNNINARFGTADDLKALSQELHNRGMWLMVDVVINDMAFALPSGANESDVDYSSLAPPFNDQKFFHPYCEITNYDNYTDAQWCWLGDDVVALPDLYTQEEEVVDFMVQWVKDVVANYSIDGLRIDAAKHVDNDFLTKFAAAPDMYTIGEVYEANVTLFCPYQDMVAGMTNYPNYFAMIEAFTAGNITALANQIAITKAFCPDTTILASFSENHDVPRFASYTEDLALAKSAIAWTIMSDGVPMIYQGQEQHFNGNVTPVNREPLWKSGYNTNSELYQFTALMNKLRKHAITVDSAYVNFVSQAIYSDDSTIALRKGYEGQQIVTVLSNSGENQSAYDLAIPTAYVPGEVVMDVVTCTNTTINQYAQLIVPMGQGIPHVYFPANKMNGSQICGMGNWSVDLGYTGKGENSGAAQSHSLSSSSMAIILASIMAFCLL